MIISENELIKILCQKWETSQDWEVVDSSEQKKLSESDGTEEPEIISVTHKWGWISRTAIKSGVKIQYSETFSFNKNDSESFDAGPGDIEDVWAINARIVDEGGEEVDIVDLVGRYGDEFESFTKIDYSEVYQCIDVESQDAE